MPNFLGTRRALLDSTAPLVLDLLGSRPAAAYSTRLLSGSYSGPVIRVRRGLDNAEQDISVNSAGDLNRDSLVNFVGKNCLPNASNTGAVVGTPGTIPNTWVVSLVSGISRQVVALGTDSGLPYVDIRFFGTATASNILQIAFQASTAVIGVTGQTWVSSGYFARVGGTSPSGNIQINCAGRTSGGTFVESSVATLPFTTTLTRTSVSRTMVGATVARVTNSVTYSVTNGEVLDFTIRCAGVQLERNSLTDYFNTTGTAAGSGFITTWYDQSRNGNHATQTTAANQPIIATTGVVDSSGPSARPTVTFTGSPLRLDMPTIPWVFNNLSTNIVTAAGTNAGGVGLSHLDTSARRWYLPYVDATNINFSYNATLASVTLSSYNANLNVLSAIANASNATGFYNGATIGNVSVITNSQDGTTWSIGSNETTGPTYSLFYVGSISEVLLFTESISQDSRQTLERNQGRYFGVTVA